MQNRAVVTGGCGFIGSHIVEFLLEKNWQVAVIDNLSGGNLKNIEKFKTKIELIIDDIRNESVLLKTLKKCDVVFHQAAFISVPESEKNPNECFDVNIGGTIKVAKAAEKCGVSKIVFASSCAVYGDIVNIPIKETDKLNPISPYAYSKEVGEKILKKAAESTNISVAALRYFNIYGPRQNPKGMYAAVISKFIEDGLKRKKINVEGTGEQTRDFTYVKDVAMANFIAAESLKEKFDVFNICSSAETSINALAEGISSLIEGVEIEYVEGRKNDIKRSCGSYEKAKLKMGYAPNVNLKEGLKMTYNYEIERMTNERRQ